jgi:hypothetical protein
MPKLDRTDAELPPWCTEAVPNIYTYIQFVYWDNRMFGVLFRSFDKFLVSIPMFVLFFGMLAKSIQS